MGHISSSLYHILQTMCGIQYKLTTQAHQRQWYDHLSKDKIVNRTRPKLAQMSELSDRNYKITVMNMLKDLVEKVDNMYDQMEKFSIVWQL